MELDELKTIWLSNELKSQKSLKMDEQSIALIQSQKLVSKLTPLYRQRLIECIFHSVAIVLLAVFLFGNILQFPYAVSAIVLLVFYVITFNSAIKQINLIRTMDFSHDLATIQSSLIILQTHMLNYARLSVLFIPTFLAYPTIFSKLIKDFDIKALGELDIISRTNGSWWIAQGVVFIILIPLGVWFYNQVTYKNLHKNWVKNFIQRSSGARVTEALEFLKELQESRQNIK